MIKKLSLLMILIFLASCSSKLVIKEPVKLYRTPTENEVILIEEGIKLHDDGQIKKAISKYNEVLALNQDNALALYELSYSYYILGDYKKSLEISLKAAEYKSEFLSMIYTKMGNCLDLLGKPKQAIEAYKKGVEINPEDFMLHYNMGITYMNMPKKDLARTYFKKTMQLNPEHPSCHIALANIYKNDYYRIPAILAYSRFLILEPNSSRTGPALEQLQNLINSGVQQKEDKSINVVLQSSPLDYDGDFKMTEMMLSLTSALKFTKKNENKSDVENLISQFQFMFSVMDDSTKDGKKKTGFVWEYYVPYFKELHKNGYTKSFFYYIFQTADNEEIQNWIKEHEYEINHFLLWSHDYKFNK